VFPAVVVSAQAQALDFPSCDSSPRVLQQGVQVVEGAVVQQKASPSTFPEELQHDVWVDAVHRSNSQLPATVRAWQ
jgi:hypothetical protein